MRCPHSVSHHTCSAHTSKSVTGTQIDMKTSLFHQAVADLSISQLRVINVSSHAEDASWCLSLKAKDFKDSSSLQRGNQEEAINNRLLPSIFPSSLSLPQRNYSRTLERPPLVFSITLICLLHLKPTANAALTRKAGHSWGCYAELRLHTEGPTWKKTVRRKRRREKNENKGRTERHSEEEGNKTQ